MNPREQKDYFQRLERRAWVNSIRQTQNAINKNPDQIDNDTYHAANRAIGNFMDTRWAYYQATGPGRDILHDRQEAFFDQLEHVIDESVGQLLPPGDD